MSALEELSPSNLQYRDRVNTDWSETPSFVENALSGIRQIEDPARRLGAAMLLKDALEDEIDSIVLSHSE